MSSVPPSGVIIRKALLADVPFIQELISYWADKDQLLPRTMAELYEALRGFWVAEEAGGGIVGCISMQIWWQDLAEVRSLAVSEKRLKNGIGSRLVRVGLEDIAALGAKRVFVLTYRPDFFKSLGFGEIDKNHLPQKIWTECIKCKKFPDCCETALMLEIDKEERR